MPKFLVLGASPTAEAPWCFVKKLTRKIPETSLIADNSSHPISHFSLISWLLESFGLRHNRSFWKDLLQNFRLQAASMNLNTDFNLQGTGGNERLTINKRECHGVMLYLVDLNPFCVAVK